MNLEDYYYSPRALNATMRLNCLQNAIQHHGYNSVLKALLEIMDYNNENIISHDIKVLFFPYDAMITSSGNFYSEELGLYV
tara:strand:+ start:653 stop:895 length:243 start_codon:yes stop_codon:yes gene_type:complete